MDVVGHSYLWLQPFKILAILYTNTLDSTKSLLSATQLFYVLCVVFLYNFTDILYFIPFTLFPQTKWTRMNRKGSWDKYGIQININSNNSKE